MRAPVVQRLDLLRRGAGPHRSNIGIVHLAELLRLDAGFDDGVDFFIARPEILQADFLAVGVDAEHILLDVETHGAGNRVGHHQRRRGQEGLLGIRVDAAVEIAVAGQHRRGIQVAVDDFLLDLRIERAGHAVAGGAGEGDDAEAELSRSPAGRFFQIQLHRLGARCQRGLSPTACASGPALALRASRPAAITLRGLEVLVQLVMAAMITAPSGISPRLPASSASRLRRCRVRGQVAGGGRRMRVGRAGHVAHHARQIELQHAFVLGAFQRIGPQAGFLA
jgi:hypothetical protein